MTSHARNRASAQSAFFGLEAPLLSEDFAEPESDFLESEELFESLLLAPSLEGLVSAAADFL